MEVLLIEDLMDTDTDSDDDNDETILLSAAVNSIW